MNFRHIVCLFCLAISGTALFAQKIVYSEPDRDDTKRMDFEVIGKIGGNFLVYKRLRNENYIAVYDNDMKQVSREAQSYIPDDRLINVDFFPYADHSFMVYQYQKKNVVYCEAVKIDGLGKKASDVMTLDTSHIGFSANNKIYTMINSEDKSKLLLFKINSRNKSNYLVTTLLFDDKLIRLKKTAFNIPMDENHDYIDAFTVDNDGDLIFSKTTRSRSETITAASLMWKRAQEDTLTEIKIPQDKIYLDEINLKADNVNKRYFLTSFYYNEKRGNVEGFYFYVWDKISRKPVLQNSLVLSDNLRKEAKGSDASSKTAFNDNFIRSIIIKKDGGFIINSESYYTTSRYNSWNRYNYLYGFGSPYSFYDYYTYYSPYYNSWAWRNRYNNSNSSRYHADNVTILSFDNTGRLQWSGVVHKEQFDDESDDRISYQTVNTGGQIHYLFNMDEKRNLLLNDFTLTPAGEITRNPTLKNLDRGYEFMPKYGKQVSSWQAIIPCYYRNYICFAKVEFN